jgi:hypothetical protein
MFLTRYLGAFTVYFHIMSLGNLKPNLQLEEAVIFDIPITVWNLNFL